MGNTCDKYDQTLQEVTLFEKIKLLTHAYYVTDFDEHASGIDHPCNQISSYVTVRKNKFSAARKLVARMEDQKPKEPKEVKPIPLSMNDFKKFKFIEDISTRYEFGDFLGQGAFGKVCKCTLNDTGNQFAIKIMAKEMVKKRKVFLELLENELSILGSKCHPKIIRIVDLLEDCENYYIVSEIVAGGELFKRLTTLESFTE